MLRFFESLFSKKHKNADDYEYCDIRLSTQLSADNELIHISFDDFKNAKSQIQGMKKIDTQTTFYNHSLVKKCVSYESRYHGQKQKHQLSYTRKKREY